MTQDQYWNGNGTFEAEYKELANLIPGVGPVKGAKNKKLERLRKASNSYYRIFNDGDKHRARIFGVRSSLVDTVTGQDLIESAMDDIILEAYAEQLRHRTVGFTARQTSLNI